MKRMFTVLGLVVFMFSISACSLDSILGSDGNQTEENVTVEETPQPQQEGLEVQESEEVSF